MCEKVSLQLMDLLDIVIKLGQWARGQNVRDVLGKQLWPQLAVVCHGHTNRQTSHPI